MENEFVVKAGQALKIGYTTGTCATAAATAAAEMLLSGEIVEYVNVILPSGKNVIIRIKNAVIEENFASCCVVKNGGDDPDSTHGMEIYARVEKNCDGIFIDGGIGIGRVTQSGLACEIGKAAINPTPMAMIQSHLHAVLKKYNTNGGLCVTIYAPKGEEVAKKTYNSRLGIVDGISILGTTGIVEPMSEKALVDTIHLCIDKKYNQNKDKIIICPGNYGRDFALSQFGIDIDSAVKISNFVGEALDYICYKGFKEALFIGHVGKMVKIAAGVMNTHSSVADCRMETIAAHSAVLGMGKEDVLKILECKTVEQANDILDKNNTFDEVWSRIINKIREHICYRVKEKCKVKTVVFSNERGLIGITDVIGIIDENIIGSEWKNI